METFNKETGVGEDLEGQSIAKLEVTVYEGRNLPKTDSLSGVWRIASGCFMT